MLQKILCFFGFHVHVASKFIGDISNPENLGFWEFWFSDTQHEFTCIHCGHKKIYK